MIKSWSILSVKKVVQGLESESYLVTLIVMATIEMIIQTLDKLDIPTTILD